MTLSPESARRKANVPISFVIAGLLAGVLLTLWAGNLGWIPSSVRPVTVERVELGPTTAATSVPATRSDTDPGNVEPLGLNAAFKRVAASVTPSVVFIQVLSNRSPLSMLRRFGGGESRVPSVSVGSGVIISEQGYVVTNNHVIEDAEEILVTLDDKHQFEARVVGSDSDTDIAVLKLDSDAALPAIALAREGDLEVGEWVLAVGNPFRLTSTVTAGIVSALGRQVDVIDTDFGIESFIQTDAAINPGNSGGALVNLKGELVGIATAIATETGSYEGYGFAVPIDMMEHVVGDLIKYGEVRRGYLGVSIGPVDSRLALDLQMPTITGVQLVQVQPGLAGYEGGLRSGDILLTINGTAVDEPNELQSLIALHGPGENLVVNVWRGGNRQTFTVRLKGKSDPGYRNWLADLGRRNGRNGTPQQVPEAPDIQGSEVTNLDSWGVGLAPMDGRLRLRFSTAHGVYIAFVDEDSAFGRAGVPRDVLLTAVDGTSVITLENAVDVLSKSRDSDSAVVVRVKRLDGVSLFFEVEVPGS